MCAFGVIIAAICNAVKGFKVTVYWDEASIYFHARANSPKDFYRLMLDHISYKEKLGKEDYL